MTPSLCGLLTLFSLLFPSNCSSYTLWGLFAWSLEFHLTYAQMSVKAKAEGNLYADSYSSFSAWYPPGYFLLASSLFQQSKFAELHLGFLSLYQFRNCYQTQSCCVVGLTTFVSLLAEHIVLNCFQCLKTIVSYIFPSFLVVYND